MRNSDNRERHEQAFVHLVDKWGKDFPIKSIWIPHIKEYQDSAFERGSGGIHREQREGCPLQDVPGPDGIEACGDESGSYGARSERKGGRARNLHQLWGLPRDFVAIASVGATHHSDCLLHWNEARRNPLSDQAPYRFRKRLIYLGPEEVKERKRKRVPIHRDLFQSFGRDEGPSHRQ